MSTLTKWTLDMLAIVVGVVIAELILDMLHERQRMLEGAEAGSQ